MVGIRARVSQVRGTFLGGPHDKDSGNSSIWGSILFLVNLGSGVLVTTAQNYPSGTQKVFECTCTFGVP